MSAEYGYVLNKPSRLLVYGLLTSARPFGGFCFYMTINGVRNMYENLKNSLLKWMYHHGHSANSLRSKPSVTGYCVGRSMIEMLEIGRASCRARV